MWDACKKKKDGSTRVSHFKKKTAPTYIYVWDRASGPIGLGPRPCGIVHDPYPVGPMALIRTHCKAQSEPKNHNESIMS